MRDVMRALTAAREGAWFKKEQEAEVWEYRKRLIREGKWDKGAFETSKDAKRNVEAAAEVLAEILQADARITSKDAMLAREVVRHGKSLPPGWRDAALRNAARRHAPAAIAHPLGTGDVSLKRGAVPRVDLGELRREALEQHLALAPEKRRAMTQVYATGVRAIAYGTALALCGVGVGVACALHLLKSRTPSALAESRRAHAQAG